MNRLASDLRHAWRAWRRTPGIALAAIVTLAIGIGANVAIFSLVDEVWLRPMAVPEPDRVVRIYTSDRSSEGEIERGPSSYPDFESLRDGTGAFAGVAALERRGALFDTGRESRLIRAAVVSGNFFDVLAPRAESGRMFTAAEAAAPDTRVVVLSYPFWRREFAADPSVTGRTIVLDRQEVLVAGVLPRGFRGSEAWSLPDVWIPQETWIALTDDRLRPTRRGFRDYDLYGRLGPGVSLPTARAELAVVAARLERDWPETNEGRRLTCTPESRSRGAEVARFSAILLAIAGLVLLLACANVASLLLARGEGQRFELATRIALGASRLRLVRQLALETAVLATAATAASLLLGGALIRLLPRLLPSAAFSAPVDAHLSGRVLLFAVAAGAASLAAFGLLPAWLASGAAPVHVLKGQRALAGAPRARLRSALVVTQVALSTVLAVSGVLLARSFVAARDANPGFDAHQNLLVLELVPGFGDTAPGADRAFVAEARRRIDALPGVQGTAVGMRIPFGLSGGGATRKVFSDEASAGSDSDGVPIHYDPVSDRFFELLGTRLLRGRAIDERDVREHARVMVVNQAMASRYWPHGEAVGQRLVVDRPGEEPYEVIGVVENSVNAELTETPKPYLYTPMTDGDYGELTFLVRTADDATRVADPVRRVLRELDPDVPTIYSATLREHMRLATSDLRLTTGLIVALGGLGMLLMAVGLHALIAFLASRRTREIGLRMALGAAPRSIFDLVVRSALRMSAIGFALGALGAAATSRALRSYLFGVRPDDPTAFATAIAVIVVVTIAAAFVPARRAARTEPLQALRIE